MTVTPTYPGVYLQEIPSGNRTIVGVATSITAFVGAAPRGPVDEPVTVNGFGDFERTFGGLDRGTGLGYAVRDFYTNGGGTALVVRVAHSTDDPDDDADVVTATAAVTLGDLVLEAVGPGAWGNELRASVSHPAEADATEVAAAQGVDADDLFTLTITEGTGAEAPTETFVNVTVADGPRRLDLVLAASAYVRVRGDLPEERPEAADAVQAEDGVDGDPPGAADYVGAESAKTGLHALLAADLFNLVCLTPPTLATDVPDDVWAEALAFCAQHRAFLLVDPPAARVTTDVADWATEAGLTGTATRNAALYFPRIRRADPLRGGAVADFVACGAVAGTFARTDGSRGVWKAPAGTEAGLTGVVAPSVSLTDAENGALNPEAVNCLRSFRGTGTVVWGARTLRGRDALADDYKYVPVRRLALFLEETLYRSTQWVVFEPNDEPLWAQIRASIGAFLQDLFRRGAFQGSTPREAYFVRCDKDTTTQYDIDRGIVNVLVGFAPLKPAEFVVIGIQQKTASATA